MYLDLGMLSLVNIFILVININVDAPPPPKKKVIIPIIGQSYHRRIQREADTGKILLII